MAKKFETTTAQPLFKDVIGELNKSPDEYDSTSTQGKKGMKLDRMNMGFSKENFEFMRVMAGLHKMSITKYCNHLIEEERKRSADIYEKAKDLMNSL